MLCLLRVIIPITLSLLAMPACWAAEPGSGDLDRAEIRSQDAVTQARRLTRDTDFKRKLHQEHQRAMDTAGEAVNGASPSLVPHCIGDDCTEIAPATLDRAREDIRQLLANPQLTGPESSSPDDSPPHPLIFISFSMPEDSLRSLMEASAVSGSSLVLRGLVENSMQRTVARLGELLDTGDNADPTRKTTPSLAIDPTLFDRFHIDKVPAFVLPLDAISPCTPDGCPVSEHLKVAGDVSLAYALGVMAREAGGTPLGRRAGRWRQRLEGRP